MPSDHWSNEKCSDNCVGSHIRPTSFASYGKKEAAQSAFRMLDSFKPNTGDMQGHLRIYEDFQGVMDLHALSDKIPIRYDFVAPFEVKIYEREGWNHLPTDQSRQACVYNVRQPSCTESAEILHFHLKASGGMPRHS
jgi:hypothetical protein